MRIGDDRLFHERQSAVTACRRDVLFERTRNERNRVRHYTHSTGPQQGRHKLQTRRWPISFAAISRIPCIYHPPLNGIAKVQAEFLMGLPPWRRCRPAN